MTTDLRPDADYELLDAGDGRRLERFGERIVDRPSPVALEPKRDPAAWTEAHLRLDASGAWHGPLDAWTINVGRLTIELRPTETGQVGLFPEHTHHDAALADWVRRRAPNAEVLHLFAYTGVTTLALAAAGASVVHVDASRPTVAWARRNAELSGLEGAPLRWLIEDAPTFARREIARRRRYDAVIVDPPSYGHGPGGQAWQIERDVGTLLAACAELTAGRTPLVLLSAHTPAFAPERLAAELATAFGDRGTDVDSGPHELRARSGAVLRLGAYARIIPA